MSLGRSPEDDLDAVELLRRRHEVSGLHGCRCRHLSEVVKRLHVAQVNTDAELELHAESVTDRASAVEMADRD